MRIVLIDPDPALRADLPERLASAGVTVETFSDPRTALLFLLARLDEVDGALVNDVDGEWSAWLSSRLEMLSPPLPVASYGAGAGTSPQTSGTELDALAAHVAMFVGASRAAARR